MTRHRRWKLIILQPVKKRLIYADWVICSITTKKIRDERSHALNGSLTFCDYQEVFGAFGESMRHRG
jgi:hypothetical protein